MIDFSLPERPRGEPKPLLDEDIGPVLARLDAWYAKHLRRDEYGLNPPATDADLDAFENKVGVKLPQCYRQLYRWHDGEIDDRIGHIYGLPLLSLRQAGHEWESWNEVLADFDGDCSEILGTSWPVGAVDPAYINPRRIPLTHDFAGNHIGLDFDPWPEGRMGQVIFYGCDEDVKAVVAESLGTFLEWIASLLESGNFELAAQQGEPVVREFKLKDPPSEHFMDGARAILGGPTSVS